MTNELHWRQERPSCTFGTAIVNKLQSLFYPLSHSVDPHPSAKEEEKVEKVTLTFREYHTVEAAETDYQCRGYATGAFPDSKPCGFLTLRPFNYQCWRHKVRKGLCSGIRAHI